MRRCVLSLFVLLSCEVVRADRQGHQVHFRTGAVTGTYTGQFKGTYTAPLSFDLEYEVFYRPRLAYFLRVTTAMDNPESRPFYFYTGIGHRFYFSSLGRVTEYEEENLHLALKPRLRFFASGEAGVAQVIVQTFGQVLQAVANMFELGAHLGASYNFAQDFGIEAQVGATMGYGYSSVSANGHTQRVFVGLNYSF